MSQPGMTLEGPQGELAFLDTPRQQEVRRQLNAAAEAKAKKETAREKNTTDGFIAGLEQLVKVITDIPKALLQTPQGAGAAAILIGATMKQLGIGILRKEFFIKERFRNEGEKWLWSSDPKLPGLVVFHGSEDAACKFMEEGVRKRTCDEKVVADPLVIDIFPFEIIGVIKEDFGKMAVPDMLMTGGFMALTGDFWKGIGEIVPG